MRPVNAWESNVQRLVTETTLTAKPDVMTWTVFNLMTDTAVLEQARNVNDEIKSIMLQLERKLSDIIARESSNA